MVENKSKPSLFFPDEDNNDTVPTIGNKASWDEYGGYEHDIKKPVTHDQVLARLREERDQAEQEDTLSEKRLMVIDGAKLQCPYASEAGILKVTSNELKLQDKIWATEGDGNNMVNLQFPGVCNHPKWGSDKPPCMSVINLSPWQNVGTTIVQEQRVLVKESCISCDPTPNTATAKPVPNVPRLLYPPKFPKRTIVPDNGHITDGYWGDKDGNKITQATIGDTVYFYITTQEIDDNKEIDFELYDYDGWLNPDDRIRLIQTSGGQQGQTYDKENVFGNKAMITLFLNNDFISDIEEDHGDEIELYFEVSYNNKIANLPANTDDYLIVYEKEVKITVIVELPHSKESGWGAKGLAGHSAMAIGTRYFDYGPDYNPGVYSEQDYDVDFNKDGDKEDDVAFDSNNPPSYHFSPGKPWWGDHIAQRKGINPEDVTLDMALEHIGLSWKDIKDSNGNIIFYGTGIYGKVHTIEFYVKESEAKKIEAWWEERYQHLKVYSVRPWNGEQCTTTVKMAINKGLGHSAISIDTQKPPGLLHELTYFLQSTSKQHKDEKTKVTVIKAEAVDWPK